MLWVNRQSRLGPKIKHSIPADTEAFFYRARLGGTFGDGLLTSFFTTPGLTRGD